MAVADEAQSQQKRFIARLQAFRDRLLQVDWRNRSILTRQVRKKWALDLAGLGPLYEGTADDALEKALLGKGSISLVLDSDSSESAETLRSSIVQLERTVRLIFEESGLRDCYLGFPFLQGHIGPDKFVRAPIVLFPVAIERVRRERGSGWYLRILEGEAPVLNRALLAAIRKVRGITIPEGIEERLADVVEPPEGGAVAVDVVLEFLRRLHRFLDDHSIPVVSQPPMSGKPQPLAPLTAEEIAQLPRTQLHLSATALVGSFPQGSSAIFSDYEALIARGGTGETDQGIVDDLLETPDPDGVPLEPQGEVSIDSIPDRSLNFALPTDGSQDLVLAQAQRAPCVVVRGPPGTGKSQVIVNLITDAISRNQRVLLVCQKRAALDVVFQRLERAGLADAALLVHDPRADRAKQYARLARRMEGQPPPEDERLRRTFDEACSAIDQTIGELNEIVHPLWEEVFGGVRPHELYAAATPGYKPTLKLRSPAQSISVEDLRQALGAMPRLEEGFRRLGGPQAPLRYRKSLAGAPLSQRAEFESALQRIEETAVEGALFVSAPFSQAELLQCTAVYNRTKPKGWRFLLPAWWKASGAVNRFARERPSDPRAKDPLALEQALSQGSNMEAALTQAHRWFNEAGRASLADSLVDPPRLRAQAVAMREALRDFEAMVEHDGRVAGLSPVAAALYLDCAEGLGVNAGPWEPTLRQEIYAGWISAFEAHKPALAGEPFKRYLELRGRLETLLEGRRDLLVQKLSQELARRYRTPKLPPGQHHPNKRPETEWRKLAHELGKQRRVKPFRRLLEEFPFQFLQLAPVWLTSPEAASDIFPLERGYFDLVVFDEASQLAVERAVPAVYRGQRTVIAGDEKQLRPFDLFQIQDDDDEEAEQEEVLEAESLLILAMRTYAPRYLSWHYRSKFQELIDFSNHAFYEGHLQIAANVGKSATSPPIEFVRVKGLWKERKNAAEAAQVVDLLQILLSGGGQPPSVGVITFNDAQRDTVLDAIEARRVADVEFDRTWSQADAPERLLDSRPFVKNLENVQGDERDVIIFSVGYAPGVDGKLRVQFGSLSQPGGENRLNVAVTRARQRVIVVASFDPKALPVEQVKNLGPKRLKEYLLYAEAVSKLQGASVTDILQGLNPDATAPAAAPPSIPSQRPFTEILREALLAEGLKADAHVGFSEYKVDLAIAHPRQPGRYIMGIECDGATFHGARSARERDVERQAFMEAHGWALERAWSRTWWRARDAEVARLKAKVEELSASAAGPK